MICCRSVFNVSAKSHRNVRFGTNYKRSGAKSDGLATNRCKSKTVDFGPGSRAYMGVFRTNRQQAPCRIGGERAEKFGNYFPAILAAAIGTQLHKAPAFYDGKINIIGKLFDSFRTVEPMIHTRVEGKPYILRVRAVAGFVETPITLWGARGRGGETICRRKRISQSFASGTRLGKPCPRTAIASSCRSCWPGNSNNSKRSAANLLSICRKSCALHWLRSKR